MTFIDGKVNNNINNSMKSTVVKTNRNITTNTNIKNTNNTKNITNINKNKTTITTNITPVKTKKQSENNIQRNITIIDSRKYNRYSNSPNSNNINISANKEKERDSLASYSKRNTNVEYSNKTHNIHTSYNNLNRSFDATCNYYDNNTYNDYNYNEESENSILKERSNYKYFNRVEKSKSKSKSKTKDDDRNISPKFGVLRKTQTTTNTNILNSNIKQKEKLQH